MTPERMQMLEQMVGGLGLHVTLIQDGSMLTEEKYEPPPVAVNRQNFLDFASEAGYSSRRASSAWRTVIREGSPRYTRRQEGMPDPYPPIEFLDPDGREAGEDAAIIDLRSVQKRLLASDMSVAAWEGLTERQHETVTFLAHLVEVKVD